MMMSGRAEDPFSEIKNVAERKRELQEYGNIRWEGGANGDSIGFAYEAAGESTGGFSIEYDPEYGVYSSTYIAGRERVATRDPTKMLELFVTQVDNIPRQRSDFYIREAERLYKEHGADGIIRAIHAYSRESGGLGSSGARIAASEIAVMLMRGIELKRSESED